MKMYNYELEHICSVKVTLQNPPEVIGPTPDGLRLNIYITGGEVRGPRLNGKVLPVGADWLTIRSDGVGVLDIRATIETDDGALIYLSYQGLADAGEDGYEKFIEGNPPSPVPLRGAPRFQTAHPDYLWLNRIQCHNVGEADLESWVVGYDLYTVK
ncbi:MAG: DUF3237 domain-containing protein [Pseudomonadales bacterium]|nr:DUF3237 domain-containing protein [Pseudomonadales bacterium]MCP5193655.1 DUF3237 domain-containing protein [Pseudomonadales bacterium]